MNLTIQREAILKPLQLVIGVVERRQTMPILANVLLTAEEQNLLLTATDLEVEVVGRAILDQPVKEAAQITVPGRKLMDICRALPGQAMIDLFRDKERVILRSGSSRFVLATLPAVDFPALGSSEGQLEFSIPQKELQTLLQRTSFAMAQQDVRYYLNGMLLEINAGIIRAVATDGHRLALNTMSSPLTGNTFVQVIAPRKGIVELLRLLDNAETEVRVAIASNHVRIQSTAFTFTSKLIDGRFPDYERVLPKNGDKILMLDREIFKEALSRASILSNEKIRGIRLQLRQGFLRVLANNPEQEEAEEIINVDYQGDDLDIGFNINYLLDVLNTLHSATIKLTLGDANSSMLVEEVDGDGKSFFVVMPLKL